MRETPLNVKKIMKENNINYTFYSIQRFLKQIRWIHEFWEITIMQIVKTIQKVSQCIKSEKKNSILN